jgi:thiosulfate dehydrogenase (quinone) large subunit
MIEPTRPAAAWVRFALRVCVALGFLSACADRFGLWPQEGSAWGNWSAFEAYTATLLPWVPPMLVPLCAWAATILEVMLAMALVLGYRTNLTARLSAALLLAFALTMATSTGIKKVLDFSVLTAAAAAFAIAYLPHRRYELDLLFERKK